VTDPDDVDVVAAKLLLEPPLKSSRGIVETVLRIMKREGWLVVPPSERNRTPPPVPRR
jgi:hypothetical protein